MVFEVKSLTGKTINQKIWFGFIFILVLLQGFAVIAFVSGLEFKSGFSHIVDETQPALLNALELRFQIEEASESLVLYLHTKEPAVKQQFLKAMRKNQALLKTLQGQSLHKHDASFNLLINKINQEMAKFKKYQYTLLLLAEDESQNKPGLSIALKQMNPLGEDLRLLSSQMANYLNSQMLSMAELNQLSKHDLTEHHKMMSLRNDVNTLRYLWVNTMLQVRGYLNYRDKPSLENLNIYIKQIPAVIKKIKSYGELLPFEVANDLEVFSETLSQFYAPLEQMIQIHGSEQWRKDAYLLRKEVSPLLKKIKLDLKQLSELYLANSKQTNQKMLDNVASNNLKIILLDIVVVVFGLWGAWIISSMIKRRLKRIINALCDVSDEGKLDRKLDENGGDEMSLLAIGFNRFVSKIKGVVDLVIASSSTLAAEAQTMSQATNQTKEGAIEQQEDTRQIVIAIGEMSMMVNEVASHAGIAAESAKDAHEKAMLGNQVVDETVNAVDTMVSDVQSAADVLHKLEKETESIDNILGVIKQITEQTNLLALNAAIEAARAGEQGRGFAVVADEVRNLAMRTQAETEDIQSHIEKFKAQALEAVKVMQQGSNSALLVSTHTRKAGEVLLEISHAVSEIDEMNTLIADSTEGQSQLAAGINTKIAAISLIAEKTVNDAISTSACSHELSLMAAQLKGLVTQFLESKKEERDLLPADQSDSDEDVELF